MRRSRITACYSLVRLHRDISNILDLWTQASAASLERHGPHPHLQATMAQGSFHSFPVMQRPRHCMRACIICVLLMSFSSHGKLAACGKLLLLRVPYASSASWSRSCSRSGEKHRCTMNSSHYVVRLSQAATAPTTELAPLQGAPSGALLLPQTSEALSITGRIPCPIAL